jgi:uncharacterized protein (TIGR02118 family)
MVKLILLLHRRQGMSRDDFRHYWRERHAPLLVQLPRLTRLVSNYPQPDPSAPEPAWDGIAENWFADHETMAAAFASSAGQAVTADSPNLLNMGKCQVLTVEEDEVLSKLPQLA